MLYGLLLGNISQIMACQETEDIANEDASVTALEYHILLGHIHKSFMSFIEELVSASYWSDYLMAGLVIMVVLV